LGKADVPWISLHDSKALEVPEINKTAQTIGPLGFGELVGAASCPLARSSSLDCDVGKSTIMGREMSTSQDFANYILRQRLHNRY